MKRRRLAVIGLAAAVAVPALTAKMSGLYAQDAAKPADAPKTDTPAAPAPTPSPAPAADAGASRSNAGPSADSYPRSGARR